MIWPPAKPSRLIYALLIGCTVAVCGWQVAEHRRVERAASLALINRGRDITSTLGVVVRSQRRFGLVVSKERIEAALQDLVRPGEIESIAILGATGEAIASAGPSVDLTPEMLRERGVYWRPHTLVLMNLMDLGSSQPEDPGHPRPPIVVADEQLSRAFRPPRRPPPSTPNPDTAPTETARPPEDAPPPNSFRRPPFGRPPWMAAEEYEELIKKKGVHSLVVSLPTKEMHQVVQTDLLLRSLISALTVAAVTVSLFAWRNIAQTAELQIRLIKAGEMNTHLKEMNLAAAGLAHETRNPLNLIRGFAQMITLQEDGPPKLKEHARTIMEEADRVTAQLNEFINYSKPRKAQLAPVEITRVVAEVVRTLVPDTEEKKITIRIPETPVFAQADEQLLRQALFNLLLNAVQAVEVNGKIEVVLTPVGPSEAVLEIRDDGPGVPPEQRELIFKPYVTLRPKGVGLGLAIVQQIILAHRWEITCHGNQPRGAIFRLSHLQLAARPA